MSLLGRVMLIADRAYRNAMHMQHQTLRFAVYSSLFFHCPWSSTCWAVFTLHVSSGLWIFYCMKKLDLGSWLIHPNKHVCLANKPHLQSCIGRVLGSVVNTGFSPFNKCHLWQKKSKILICPSGLFWVQRMPRWTTKVKCGMISECSCARHRMVKKETLLGIVVGLCGTSGNTLYWVLLFVMLRLFHVG
jgi:hypothetical protein